MSTSPRALVLFGVLVAACSGAPKTALVAPAPPPKKLGAVFLAQPGTMAMVGAATTPLDVFHGRTHWQLDADGTASRTHVALRDPVTTAIGLPPWLGGGQAVLGEAGVVAVAPSGALKPLLRGSFSAPSIGARELWMRARGVAPGEWVRLDPTTGLASWEEPPIAAPIVGVLGVEAGVLTAGPEFLSPKIGYALVDLLGPVRTDDGGATWTALDSSAISSAFPLVAGPNALARLPSGLGLASGPTLALLSPTGQIGAPTKLEKSRELPDVLAVRLETEGLRGVPLDDGRILFADQGRFAIATVDPPRIVRVVREPELEGCRLRPAPKNAASAVAIAACIRHDDSVGVQLVVGSVSLGASGPHLAVERTFPFPSAFRFSSDGAIAVSSGCAGDNGNVDFQYASKACVRDGEGAWHEITLAVSSRLLVVPRLDGGVIVAKDSGGSGLVLYGLGPTPAQFPKLLAVDAQGVSQKRELIDVDEVEPGKLVVWRRVESSLEALRVTVDPSGALRFERSQALPLGPHSAFGTSGAKALVVRFSASKKEGKDGRSHIDEALVSTDAGVSFRAVDWPEPAASPLVAPSAPINAQRLECAALGCSVFGWSRFGWQHDVATIDDLVDTAAAPQLPPPPPLPEKNSTLELACTTKGTPVALPPKILVDAYLGAPLPSWAPGEQPVLGRVRGATRGWVVASSPSSSWADFGRLAFQFTTDLDAPGTVHHTVPIALPFADRPAAARVLSQPIRAFPLAAGRVLLVLCDLGRCNDHVYRARPGVPLEKVDLSAVSDISQVVNARELGGTLLLAGRAAPREKPGTAAVHPEERPFFAVVSASGTAVTFLDRSAGEPAATTNAALGLFGLLLRTPQASWLGGSTFVLPLEADGRPSGAFQRIGLASSDLAQPTSPCDLGAPSWDIAELQVPSRVQLIVDGAKIEPSSNVDAVLRTRSSTKGACIERLSVTTEPLTLGYDAVAGTAQMLRLVPKADKVAAHAERSTLACTPPKWL